MFKKDELVSVYTRAQAIDDGVLIDVSEHAKGIFKVPVAVTCGLYSELERRFRGADIKETVISLLGVVRQMKRRIYGEETVEFSFNLIKIKAVSHGGDFGEDVLTVMLKNED